MGSISYDAHTVTVEDRTLTHLQVVIVNKLRRGDAFLMSWRDSIDAGSGRSSTWSHPGVLILFKFAGSRIPATNERWLKELAASADSSRGLIVTAEHGQIPHLRPTHDVSPWVTVITPARSVDPTAAPPPGGLENVTAMERPLM